MRINNLGKLFLFLLFTSCSNYSNETQKLDSILLHYDEYIPQNNHLYIIQSQYYCDGCIQSIYLQLQEKLIKLDKIPITIVRSDKKYIPSSILSKVSFINDTLRLADREFSSYANMTFFETNNGKVINYKNIGDSKKNNLPKFVNDFFINN